MANFCSLRPGDHVCLMYDTEEDHRQCLTLFMRHGLERGEQLLYLAHDHTPETILSYLEDDGLAPEALLESGQLRILEAREVYLAGGEFDPDAMLERLEEAAKAAVERGFTGMRGTGEMTWALGGAKGAAQLMEYECRINAFGCRHNAILLCQYDRRQFTPLSLLEVMATHPVVLEGGVAHRHGGYAAPQHMTAEDPCEALLRQRLKVLKQETRLRQTVERQGEFMSGMLDAVTAPVMVLDPAGRVVFFNLACEAATGYQLSEVGGHLVDEFTAKSSPADCFGQVWQQLAAGEAPAALPLKIKARWGRVVRRNWTCLPLRDGQGDIEYVIATGHCMSPG